LVILTKLHLLNANSHTRARAHTHTHTHTHGAWTTPPGLQLYLCNPPFDATGRESRSGLEHGRHNKWASWGTKSHSLCRRKNPWCCPTHSYDGCPQNGNIITSDPSFGPALAPSFHHSKSPGRKGLTTSSVALLDSSRDGCNSRARLGQWHMVPMNTSVC
jgi:hypothetical protein